jgi:hypothetical protein
MKLQYIKILPIFTLILINAWSQDKKLKHT